MATLSNVRLDWNRLKAEAEPSQVLIHTIPAPTAVVDSSGTIRSVNGLWLSVEPVTQAGDSYLAFCDCVTGSRPDLRSELSNGIRAVLNGRAPQFQRDFPMNGDFRGRKTRVSAVQYTNESIKGALLIRQDVEEGAQDEETRRQAQKMETVGRLVGGVAHDFANLLTLIAGYSEILLARVNGSDPLRPELEEIRKAANRGSRLTSQLLTFTRGQSVQPRPLDLNALITELERMLRPIIGEYVDLRISLAPDLGRVVADPGQMEQVIMNLVLNARDAVSAGGRIVIATVNREIPPEEAAARSMQAGPVVELTITDNGHGISAETLEHIFEPFFTTKEKGRGTGLGLNTVHTVVKQNKGDVWAASTPGVGTVFTVWLPRADFSAESADPVASRQQVSSDGDETILLVEDEESVRRLLTHILDRRGYRVVSASSAEEALKTFEEHAQNIDLLLTDMVMPGLSGRELAERVHQIRPDLKVIYMSGYTDDVLVRTGALSPGMSFLQKPLRPEVLAGKVREALDGRSTRNTAAG